MAKKPNKLNVGRSLLMVAVRISLPLLFLVLLGLLTDNYLDAYPKFLIISLCLSLVTTTWAIFHTLKKEGAR